MITNDTQMTGAIGESLVVSELIKQGWAAMNVNAAVRNCKATDVICVKCDEDTWQHQSSLIQVKARRGKDFPTGFSLRQSIDWDELNNEVKGPYVFVALDENNNPDYYILSRSQFIKLLYSLHDRYCNHIPREKPHRTGRNTVQP